MPYTPRRAACGLVSGVVLVVLFVGCTGSASTTTASTGPGTPATSIPPPAGRQVTEATQFTSPTRNIGCYIELRYVRCDVGERDWQPPPKPADCDLDFGQGISLSAGGSPHLVCAGDTAHDATKEPLPYGESITAGSLRCESEESGMSCSDLDTGRGFTISRQDYSFR